MCQDKRISRQQLIQLGEKLSERDKSILLLAQKFRYLTTSQIQRLYFRSSSSHSAALRAADRALMKLRDYHLIVSLKRRIGGIRAGSGSYVWSLSPSGVRLLGLMNSSGNTTKRQRSFEPSPRFLEHTLAVAEIYVQLNLLQNQHKDLKIQKVEVEPDCWRTYVGINGTAAYLKPDLYLVTVSGEYEDHWFIEIDLDTESPSRVIRKCRQYYRYYLSGKEQQTAGVFPWVVWIVPSESRIRSLQQCLTEEPFIKQKDIFAFIMSNKLEKTICLK